MKKISLIALALLIPAPSFGVWAGMIAWPDQPVGKALFFVSKLWILALPLAWRIFVDKKPLSFSKPSRGGFGTAVGLGVGICLIILGFYYFVGRRLIDPQMVKEMAAQTGLNKLPVYLTGAVYWITINSILEEYVWRWFVVEKFTDLVSSRSAITLSALAFTLHHILAMQIYFNPLVTALAAAGIWIGGACWSWCYLRYQSIWPGYLSHALVDLAVFGIGYLLIFS
jgi:membrane protease YdiL (CAAX protease family)